MEEDRVLTEEAGDRIINEEYKIWKKNAPFLYDLVMTHSLDWPSLTVQWLPGHSVNAEKHISIHKLLIGTHTSGSEPNYLMVADVSLPTSDAVIDANKYDDEKREVGGFGGVLSKIDIKIRIAHEGEVNRARVMPQNQFIVASKGPSPTVFVFDYSKHGSMPVDGQSKPQHRCLGHTSEGYGLSWNPNIEGQLLSGSDDGLICLWDVRESAVDLHPISARSRHSSAVEDVDWHRKHSFMFGSVGDDSRIVIWDTREPADKNTAEVLNAHEGHIHCLSFNPTNEYLLATGGADGKVALWDLRNLGGSIHDFKGHSEGVFQVLWAPFNEAILGSCSSDRRLHVWDLSRIGEEQSPEDALDGPPELLFIHGGHTAKVSDFSWNFSEQWTVASVAEDNVLQIWQMAENIYNDQDDDEDAIDDEDLEPADDQPSKKKSRT